MLEHGITIVCGSHSERCWRSPSLCWGEKDTPTQFFGGLLSSRNANSPVHHPRPCSVAGAGGDGEVTTLPKALGLMNLPHAL